MRVSPSFAAAGQIPIQSSLGDDVVNYWFPKDWPTDREQRARYIGEWLKTEARYSPRDKSAAAFRGPSSSSSKAACDAHRHSDHSGPSTFVSRCSCTERRYPGSSFTIPGGPQYSAAGK
jgi:hypothetical protein